jgi:FkbH-like protein
MTTKIQAPVKRESTARQLLRKAVSRDSGLNLSQKILKALDVLMDTVNAQWQVRKCTKVGAGPRVKGRMRVENHGSITIGERFSVVSRWIPLELLTGPRGRIEIGNHVWANFGAMISAQASVSIGDRVMIGQHTIVADTAFPDHPNAEADPTARPIEIGNDVWLAGRVTVYPGVRIGAGAVIMAGSIVTEDIPPSVIAGGIPARPLWKVKPSAPAGQDALHASVGTKTVSPVAASTAAPAPQTAVTPPPPQLHGHLIANFTIDELAIELLAPDLHPPLGAKVAPFDQVTQMLLSSAPANAADFAVVWTQPAGIVPSFARVLRFESVEEAELLQDVDAFCELVVRAAQNYRFIFLPSWSLPSWNRGLGMLDSRTGGSTRALVVMNLRLMDRLSGIANVFVLNSARWLHCVGPTAINLKAWYLGKMAVSQPALREAARDIRAAMCGLLEGPRKLLVLDLDDTLWGGIVGDTGVEGLRLGGPDPSGEAYRDFQRALKNLKRRGIVLAIVSKNEEAVALHAIRTHPSMELREEDFVGWRINWQDKAQNILELSKELNLGLQSVVFIDDNPAERARVKDALPEVYVPEWPQEEFLYVSALLNLRCFDAPVVSREDLERTQMYGHGRQRDELRRQVGSVEDWLQTLAIRISIAPLDAATSVRASQLLNKTNQLNLSTRRLSEPELLAWAASPQRVFWVVDVADRFGESGLTGLLSLEFEGETATVIDFVLSCRVMGRKVEESMVHVAVVAAAARGASKILARYIPTAKNKPCLSFWRASGFANDSDTLFSRDTATPYPLPDCISLDWRR